MKVIEIVEPGGPEVLRISERPDPEPGPREVIVHVWYSGINRADLLQRLGRYPPPEGFPADIPGLEYCGVVEGVGVGCTLRRVGDRVMGVLGGGGYAEKVVVSERETIRVPEGLPMDGAGGVPEAFMTAWDAMFSQAHLSCGEVVLIHAVGSGVGTAALQLAKVAGARTIGTSRSQDKLERARELGLDEGVLAGGGDDWAAQVRDKNAEAGVDVVLDLVGADYLDGNLSVLGQRSRWMVIGVPSGSRGGIDLRRLMALRASITGTVLRARSPEEKAQLARAFDRTVVPLFESGRITPVLDRVFPTTDAAEAHRYVEGSRNFGTVVLAWGAHPTEDP